MKTLLLMTILALPQDGDRWHFVGDSITDNGTYRRTIERVLRHFGRRVETGNFGVSGATSALPAAPTEKQPAIVSIMFGMNNCINSAWRPGQPMQPFLDAYRTDITAKARASKAAGARVLLMTPTLTDESYSGGIYELKGTREFLKACAGIVRDVAATEGVECLPVQEEFEAYQQTLLPDQVLRADGVHPSALGQYQIARTFWEHFGIATSPVPVSVSLDSRFITNAVILRLKSPQPVKLQATWTHRDQRRTDPLNLTGDDTWTIPVLDPSDSIVIDLTAGHQQSLYIVDLSRVPVIHLKDGKAAGENWRVETAGKGLRFSGEVASELKHPDDFWPWARDGVCVWLDARPPERFADINVDADVHQALLLVRDKPFFGCTLLPWLGIGMQHAADVGAERTPTGFRWHLLVHRYFAKPRPVDFSRADFVGFNIIAGKAAFTPAQPHDKFANTFMVLDLKNKLPGDWVTHAHLFGK